MIEEFRVDSETFVVLRTDLGEVGGPMAVCAFEDCLVLLDYHQSYIVDRKTGNSRETNYRCEARPLLQSDCGTITAVDDYYLGNSIKVTAQVT